VHASERIRHDTSAIEASFFENSRIVLFFTLVKAGVLEKIYILFVLQLEYAFVVKEIVNKHHLAVRKILLESLCHRFQGKRHIPAFGLAEVRHEDEFVVFLKKQVEGGKGVFYAGIIVYFPGPVFLEGDVVIDSTITRFPEMSASST
jgi:hypothetical protein